MAVKQQPKATHAWAVFTPEGNLIDGSVRGTKKKVEQWVASEFGVSVSRVLMRGFQLDQVEVNPCHLPKQK